MGIVRLVIKVAALFGVHTSRLSKHPATTVLGLTHRPIDLIIDVGGNIGQFAKISREKFPHAHIISIEPLPAPFAQLEAWAKQDGNTTALNIGVGEVDGVLSINLHLDHSPSSSMLPTLDGGLDIFPQMTRQETIKVPVRRLDDVLAEIGRPAGPNTLLKLDVQGFEEYVLRGAPETLRKVSALLTEVSIDTMYEGQAEFFNLCQLAYSAGLRYAGNYSQYPANDGHVIFLDACFTR